MPALPPLYYTTSEKKGCSLNVCMHTAIGGSLFLFDRRAVRFFRKDGHNWRKKADGKTVRETHEKLKVRMHAFCCIYATITLIA